MRAIGSGRSGDVDRLAVQNASPCPICGAREARPRFEVVGLAPKLIDCTGCGVGRLDPMPTPEEVRGFYPDEYYGEPGTKFQPFVERMVRFVGERHISFLSRSLSPGAQVLDVGCGRGVILRALADRGFEVHGVEISVEATCGADPRAEIRISPRLVDAGYASGSFEEVVIWHVLEHLDDPKGVVQEIHRILSPGGRLIVALQGQSSRHLLLTRGSLLLRKPAAMLLRLSWRTLLRLSVLQIMPSARCVRSVGFPSRKAKR